MAWQAIKAGSLFRLPLGSLDISPLLTNAGDLSPAVLWCISYVWFHFQPWGLGLMTTVCFHWGLLASPGSHLGQDLRQTRLFLVSTGPSVLSSKHPPWIHDWEESSYFQAQPSSYLAILQAASGMRPGPSSIPSKCCPSSPTHQAWGGKKIPSSPQEVLGGTHSSPPAFSKEIISLLPSFLLTSTLSLYPCNMSN